MDLRRLKADLLAGVAKVIPTSLPAFTLPTYALLALSFLTFALPSFAQPAASFNYLTRTGTLGTTYAWIDCSAGTEIVTGDDAQASFNWPFNFRFYDNTYSPVNSLSVCTNGFIRLDAAANATYTAATNYSLTATATELGQIIAAAVYDGDISPANSGWVKFVVTGTAPYRILTIEYNNLEIDYDDNKFADVQVSFYESTNTVVLKFGTDNISVNGVDMGIHSGVSGYFNKWQEVKSGTHSTWIEYAMPALPAAASWNYSTQTGTLGSLYNWIDCSAGATVVSGDDAQGSFNWPFNFSFYDNNYNISNSLSVSTNGFIRLDGAATNDYTAASNYDLTASATSLGQIIATSVYDGYVGQIAGSWCRRLVTGTAPYRVLTVEFNNYEIDYNDALYADVQVSFYETLNEVVVKYGNDNISATGVDMGIHSGVSGYYHKWQEALTGTNNSWIRYTRPIEVNATLGTGIAFYATLKAAFDNINNGNHRGNITVKINGSTVETATATLNASGSGSALYTSIQVYPTFTGLSITGNLAAPLIDLNGADNVVIDGRVNATGTTPNLLIGNTSVSSIAGTSTLRFINDASNNIVRYCVIKGAETVASSGVVFFSTTSLTSGNDNNTLSNNLITATSANSRPVNAVYSAGTAGKENSDNAITNNLIFDFLRQASASNGINLSANNTAWSITGNSLYETGSLAPTASVDYTAITVNSPTGGAFNISNNFIGGTGAQCSGTPFTKTSTANNTFHAISLNAGTAAASSIQNNLIRNFNWSNSGNAGVTGIEVLGGNANIGNLAGNILGAPTGTGSIVITNSTDGVAFYGIELAGNGILDCKNNTIGAISAYNSNPSFRSDIIAINVNNTGSCIVQHSIIGSETTPNSLLAGSPSTAAAQSVTGVLKNASGSLLVEHNIIANLTNTNAGNAADPSASVGGIIIAGSGQVTVSGNRLYNLTNSYPTFTGSILGIYSGSTYTEGENTVNGNFIYNLDATGGSLTNASVYGIKINNGLTIASNNIISITNNTPVTAYGIYETGSAVSTSKLYFNTVYLGGTLSAGTVNKSYALYSAVTSNTRDFRNNILVNARSTNAGSSLHYALYIVSTGGTLTVDHNDYYTPGTGGIIGYYGVDDITLPIVAGQDGGSVVVNPSFALAGGPDPLDYYSATDLPGVAGTGITNDFSGLTRNSIPKMGALENNRFYWKGTLSSNFGTPGNWLDGVVPTDGADISFDPAPVNHCLLDQNRVLNNITIGQSTYMLVLNGHTLTVTGNLELTNGARLDATSPLSRIIFAGQAQQIIPSAGFFNNTVNALEAANPEGLVLNGNLTISSGLTLTAGTFHLGANTLTINGPITTTAGSLTGGATSTIIAGGSGTSILLPAVELNNLTINRDNGVTLTGNASVSGTLTLTQGVLTVGANTLTLSGNAPVLTAGSIDASEAGSNGNTGATLLFANSNPMILPANLFSSAVQNMVISGSGGITAGSGFVVNGTLHLQGNNPAPDKGLLDMGVFTLDMGSDAVTTGTGDVTGIVRRTSFIPNRTYTFSHANASITFPAVGVLPAEITLKTTLGTAPSWKPGAVKRIYDLIQTGGSGTNAVIRTHYLDTELNGNDENMLVDWSYRFANGQTIEHGRSNFNGTDNWIDLSNVDVAFFPSTFGNVEVTMAASELTSLTWNGSVSSSWVTPDNWTPTGAPSDNTIVMIPDAATTPNDPFLPAIATCGTLTLHENAILNSQPNAQLTINGAGGAWTNLGGTFYPQSSTIRFTHAEASLIGSTNFFNLTVATGAGLTLADDSHTAISGTLTNGGILDATFFHTTVEYNGGDQQVLNTNGTSSDYHNLILSGSGNKTLPATLLSINGNLTVSGTANMVAGETVVLEGTTLQQITGTSVIQFEKLEVNNPAGIILFSDITLQNELLLTAGTLNLGSNTITINGTISQTAGNLAVNEHASLTIGGTTNLTLGQSLFTSEPVIGNLTVSRSGGVTIGCNMTVAGTLHLPVDNPTSINGVVDMWDGTAMTTLTMGENSVTTGAGDVTGIVKRTVLLPNTTYTFGNQHTHVRFPDVGTLPTEISVKIRIGVAPDWKPGAVQRIYDVIQIGGSGTLAILSTHYLDSELNGNVEGRIVDWSYRYAGAVLTEHGRSNYNTTENWVSLSNANIAFFSSAFGAVEVTLDESELTSLIWNGSVSNSWVTAENWTPNGAPSDNTIVIIPDASTTNHDPILPAFAICGTITLEANAILDAGDGSLLTLTGASGVWSNQGGTFNASTSTVTFTSPDATINGHTNFHNFALTAEAGVLLSTGSHTGISGAIINNGILRAAFNPNTIEYNGDNQTIINPNGLNVGYYNLLLNGTGSGNITAQESLTVTGSFVNSSSTTFHTGSFEHIFKGNLENNGTIQASTGSTLTLSGTAEQLITGTASTDVENLLIQNSAGVYMQADLTINNNLILSSGILHVQSATLGINGTINRLSGNINVSSASSLSFGGTNAITLAEDLFVTVPELNNLTINRTGGVTFTTNVTVNGQLDLQSANPTDFKGSLDMFNGVEPTTLFMGATAITTGTGDVTGIVTISSIVPNTTYTMGSAFTSVTFPDVGTLPAWMSIRLSIGNSPTWKPGAINRVYDVIQSGGSGTQAILVTHYLDTELNGNDETQLVDFSYRFFPGILTEHGRSAYDATNNWVSLSNVDIAFFVSTFGAVELSLSALELMELTWNGSVSTSWNTTDNWTPQGAPADHISLIIPDAALTPNDPILSASSSCKSITLQSGSILNAATAAQLTITGAEGAWNNQGGTFNPLGSTILFTNPLATIIGSTNFYNLTISSGATLTPAIGSATAIAGVLTNHGTLNTGDNFTLLSTAQGTALISGLGTGTIQGNITMQRYIPDAFGYRYICSPFTAATVNELADEADLQASFPTLYRYEENRDTAWWFDYTATAGLLKPMAGYALNLGTTATAATIDMTGEVSTGPMSVTLGNHNRSITQGFNLVGNPYPSPIDWDAENGWTRTNVDNAVYYFNPGTSNQYVGSYSTYISGVSSDGIADNIIPAMQGFFVHVTDGSYPVTGSLGFSNDIRVNDPNPVFHKKTSLLSAGTALVRVAASYQGIGAAVDPVVLLLGPEGHDFGQTDPTGTSGQANNDETPETPSAATNPQFDAIKLLNTDPYAVSFYALTNQSRYAIKTWSLSADTDQPTVIPLGISLLTPGLIEFSLLRSQLYELYPGCRLYFHDRQTRAIINLEEANHTIFLEKGTYHDCFSLLLSYSELETSRGSSTELNAFYQDGRIAVYLDLPADEKGTLHIADITGRILHSGTYTGIGYHYIAMNSSPGIYIVTLRSASGVSSRKIFVP